jgi:hypothetical protein
MKPMLGIGAQKFNLRKPPFDYCCINFQGGAEVDHWTEKSADSPFARVMVNGAESDDVRRFPSMRSLSKDSERFISRID